MLYLKQLWFVQGRRREAEHGNCLGRCGLFSAYRILARRRKDKPPSSNLFQTYTQEWVNSGCERPAKSTSLRKANPRTFVVRRQLDSHSELCNKRGNSQRVLERNTQGKPYWFHCSLLPKGRNFQRIFGLFLRDTVINVCLWVWMVYGRCLQYAHHLWVSILSRELYSRSNQ